ncbi:hypothetical protein BDV12DRAFT_32840 [Aspergillus spectabilis]
MILFHPINEIRISTQDVFFNGSLNHLLSHFFSFLVLFIHFFLLPDWWTARRLQADGALFHVLY